jgi:predicted NUDIX family NTP pyrophosphohydrolase
MYRERGNEVEFLLVHPGGPLWQRKDADIWSIPKGEIHPGEGGLEAAKREFEEELGFNAQGAFIELTPVTQQSGKIVHAWAFAGDCDPGQIRSNTFSMEWPPHSGRTGTFPEVDRAEFLSLEQAKGRINPAQTALLEELLRKLVRNK